MAFHTTIERLKFEQTSIDNQIIYLQDETQVKNPEEADKRNNCILTLRKESKQIDDAITILYNWTSIRVQIETVSKYKDIQRN